MKTHRIVIVILALLVSIAETARAQQREPSLRNVLITGSMIPPKTPHLTASVPVSVPDRPSLHGQVGQFQIQPVSLNVNARNYQPIPNGCGSDASLLGPNVVPQQIGGVDFSKACDRHDICYGTAWNSKSACDNTFRADMLRSCQSATSIPDYSKCVSAANAYYGAVAIGGGSAFQQGQYTALFTQPSGHYSLMAPAAPVKYSLLESPGSQSKYSLLGGSGEQYKYGLIDWSKTFGPKPGPTSHLP